MGTENQKPVISECEEQGSGARIGIIGGTFDPIHLGHLIIAEEARYQFQLDRVIFIPAGVPPHKPDRPITDKEHRFDMTVLATEDNPAFEVSRIEIDRSGPSYAVDTLAELKKIYGNNTRLFFIIGADAILEILTWYKPEKLRCMCRFIATTRPGYRLSDVKKKLPEEYLERITFMDAPGVNVSATDLRNRAASGRPIKYMVPKAVEDYITDNKLYVVEK
ncbi:MAG: nicotinate-nucleotide adenylyltransferase [Armatimonadota bacterium]